MQTTLNQRLKELVATRFDGKDAGLAEVMGLSKQAISDTFNKNTNPRSSAITNLLSACSDISAEWLLRGVGSMTIEKGGEKVYRTQEHGSDAKPYFDVDFIGGFDEIINDQTVTPSAYISAPFPKAQVWVNVTGHSMEPAISHGDIIALREVGIEDVQYGEIYAVVLDNFRTIKTLRKGSERGLMRFVPTNEDFDEQEFPISRIRRVYEVVGLMKKFS